MPLSIQQFFQAHEDALCTLVLDDISDDFTVTGDETEMQEWTFMLKGAMAELASMEDSTAIPPFEGKARGSFVCSFTQRFKGTSSRSIDEGSFLLMLKQIRKTMANYIAEHAPAEQMTQWLLLCERYFSQSEECILDQWSCAAGTQEAERLKLANAELAREKTRYLKLFDNLHDPIFILDPQGRIEGMNSAAARFLSRPKQAGVAESFSRGSFSGHSLGEILPWLGWDLLEFLDDQSEFSHVGKEIRTQGIRRWYDVAFTAILEDGKTKDIVVVVEDVTDRRKAAEMHRETALWMKSMFNALSEAVFILTPERVIVEMNNAALTMTGYSREQLMTMGKNVLHPDEETYGKYLDLVKNALRDGESGSFEFSLRKKDGTVFPTEHTVSRLIRADGTELGFISVIRDISEQRRAKEKIRSERDRANHYLDIAGSIIVALDNSGNITLINKEGCEILGKSQEKLIGKNWIDTAIPPEQQAAVKMIFAEIMQGNIARFSKVVNHDIINSSGERRIVSWNNSLIRDKDGNVTGSLSAGIDVTLQIQAQRELEKSENRYRMIFENSPISLMEEDFSLAKQYFDTLKELGVTEFESFFRENPHEVKRCADLVIIRDVNHGSVSVYAAQSKDDLRGPLSNILDAVSHDGFARELAAFASGRTELTHELRIKDLKGNLRDIRISSSVAPGFEDNLGKVLVSILDITDRKRMEEELRRLATTDSMTGAFNRRHFLQLADLELNRAQRYNRPMCIMMLDIDHFKRVNDSYGHHVGDLVLKALVKQAHETIRSTDIFGRLGGEEFALVVTETDIDHSLQLAERLRKEIEKMEVQTDRGVVTFTVSIGVTCMTPDDREMEPIMVRADRALYEAKDTGRNRVCTR